MEEFAPELELEVELPPRLPAGLGRRDVTGLRRRELGLAVLPAAPAVPAPGSGRVRPCPPVGGVAMK